jgi:hypothetical protein
MGHKFWSLDLTAATDRFPIALQEKLMANIYDESLALSWKNILVNRDFKFNDSDIRYSVGQPMGAYSSWAVFTITHHLVVHWAAHLCGLENFNKYILLGDDIVINHDKVAQKYISIMTKLGVEISMNKTHISRNTYEFAKRWIQNKIEISGIPLRGILNNLENPLIVLQQLMVFTIRSSTNHKGTLLEVVSKMYHQLKIGRRFYSSSNIFKRCFHFYHILRYAYGLTTASEIRGYLSRVITNPDILIPNDTVIPLFLRAVLSHGLSNLAERAGNEIRNHTQVFRTHFEKFDDYDMSDLGFHPSFCAFQSKIWKLKTDLMEMRNSKEFNLLDSMSLMQVESPEKLVLNFRDSHKLVPKLDKLWNFAIQSLKKINDENYENYGFVWNFENNDDLKPWESHYIDGLSQVHQELDSLKTPITSMHLYW